METLTIREACLDDLPQVYDIFYENEVGDDPAPPAQRGVPAELRHELDTGEMYVAERDGRILGFTALTTRGSIAYLSGLFVRRSEQLRHVGTTLLQQVLPRDARIRCTLASTDHRALALYIRAGMRPQWPNLCLRANAPASDARPQTDVTIVEGRADDPELVRWDAKISGRLRPEDHAFWVREQRAVPLWFQRQGMVVGYGYVRLGAGTIYSPEACTLGPIGARTPDAARACVLAAVVWARAHAAVLRIDVPGPHPSLATLLDAHFRIRDVETFMSAARTPFVDAQCYLGSGGVLF
jgi:GNAT superfamily N-acetyltransferase